MLGLSFPGKGGAKLISRLIERGLSAAHSFCRSLLLTQLIELETLLHHFGVHFIAGLGETIESPDTLRDVRHGGDALESGGQEFALCAEEPVKILQFTVTERTPGRRSGRLNGNGVQEGIGIETIEPFNHGRSEGIPEQSLSGRTGIRRGETNHFHAVTLVERLHGHGEAPSPGAGMITGHNPRSEVVNERRLHVIVSFDWRNRSLGIKPCGSGGGR